MEEREEMEAVFHALDKDSGQCLTQSVLFSTEAELRAAWEDFCDTVPFDRWYADNEFYGEDEEMREIVEEELE